MCEIVLQFLIVLLALYVGSRYGSLALGAISGIGLAIFVLCWGMKLGTPPTSVIYIIIAVVTCAGMMQASVRRINYEAFVCLFFFCFFIFSFSFNEK